MKRLTPIAIGSIAFCASVAAYAMPPEKKVELGLRSGYALPLGDAYSAGSTGDVFRFPNDVHMKDVTSGMIPIWIEAGYRVTPEILIGAYFQYGFASVKTRDATSTVGCAPAASCSARDIRYGVQAQYHFAAAASLDPWLGIGFGRETFSFSSKVNGQETDGSLNGWEYANLQGGLDVEVADAFALGPFVSFSLGQYSTLSADVPNFGTLSLDVPSALHEWLTLGVKGTLGL